MLTWLTLHLCPWISDTQYCQPPHYTSWVKSQSCSGSRTLLYTFFLLRPPALAFPNSQTNDLTSHFIEEINWSHKETTLSSHHHFHQPTCIYTPVCCLPSLQWKKFLRSPLLLVSDSYFLSLSQLLCSSGDPLSFLHYPFSPFCWLIPIGIKICLNITHLKQQSKLKTSLDPHIYLQLPPHFSASLHG